MYRTFSDCIARNMKAFRKDVLKISLTELSMRCYVPVSTIWTFEQGNSSNINNIGWYAAACRTLEQKKQLSEYIKNLGDVVLNGQAF